MASHKTSQDWKCGSKRRVIAELAERGMTKMEAFSTLKPLVVSQTEPMVFRANPPKGSGRGREPKPISTQLIELKNEIGRVWVELGKSSDKSFDSEETPSYDDFIPEDQEEESDEESEETKDEENADRCYTRDVRGEMRYFLKRVKEIRRFCIDRKARFQQTLDNISMRPTQEGKKLLVAGVPADLLLLAMTMHWEPEMRREAGINDFDFNTTGSLECHPEFLRVSRWVMKSRGIDPAGKHDLFGYALLLVENRVPMLLIGPAGTGKSHLVRQLAEYMEMDYAETPMSTGASRSDLLGRHTISQENPFITSEFQGMYGSGGFFNFEEIDRADPGVVITLNNALAGKRLYNSVNGEVIERHDDFVPAATANTFGLGTNREYTAAERMEASTLDRFRMGRIFIPIDESLEETLFFQDI